MISKIGQSIIYDNRKKDDFDDIKDYIAFLNWTELWVFLFYLSKTSEKKSGRNIMELANDDGLLCVCVRTGLKVSDDYIPGF